MSNKHRILFLLNYLQKNTDEANAVSAMQLRRIFRENGMNATAATLRDDIATLKEAGYDIDVQEKNGVATWYKYLDREWSAPEVQILVDAVASAQFIPEKKSRQLIDRLVSLAAPSEREHLAPGIRVEDQLKAQNDQLLYTIQAIREAMEKDRRITFRHYVYSPKVERVPKHDGYVYEVSPYAMVWKQDRYYLVGWSEKHDGVARFRIDRMELPEIISEPRRPVPDDLRLEDHSDKIFWMFDGPEAEVVLRFKPELMNQIVDRFGTDLVLKNVRKKRIDVVVKVHLSPTFYAWLFQYSGDMTVISPDYVCQEYAKRLEKSIDDALGN